MEKPQRRYDTDCRTIVVSWFPWCTHLHRETDRKNTLQIDPRYQRTQTYIYTDAHAGTASRGGGGAQLELFLMTTQSSSPSMFSISFFYSPLRFRVLPQSVSLFTNLITPVSHPLNHRRCSLIKSSSVATTESAGSTASCAVSLLILYDTTWHIMNTFAIFSLTWLLFAPLDILFNIQIRTATDTHTHIYMYQMIYV